MDMDAEIIDTGLRGNGWFGSKHARQDNKEGCYDMRAFEAYITCGKVPHIGNFTATGTEGKRRGKKTTRGRKEGRRASHGMVVVNGLGGLRFEKSVKVGIWFARPAASRYYVRYVPGPRPRPPRATARLPFGIGRFRRLLSPFPLTLQIYRQTLGPKHGSISRHVALPV
ncbi:hypothetical protein LZ32DRAFT_11659 [Colletotrichum eremochloae]|nr:hypothetical protein LZ32DRAFT_11659 [Colletotrichum eremochloae]